ncbi:MAG: efflux RND transporter periplasmic adaptor subunit [Oscillospiraceae bacterium]
MQELLQKIRGMFKKDKNNKKATIEQSTPKTQVDINPSEADLKTTVDTNDVMTEIFGTYVSNDETLENPVSSNIIQDTDENVSENAEDNIAKADFKEETEYYDDYDTATLSTAEIIAAADELCDDEYSPNPVWEDDDIGTATNDKFAAENPEQEDSEPAPYYGYAPRVAANNAVDEIEYIDISSINDTDPGLDDGGKKKKRFGFNFHSKKRDSSKPKSNGKFKSFCKKHKKSLIGVSASIGMVCLILVFLLVWSKTVDPLKHYTKLTVGRGNVIQSITTGGTVQSSAKYNITSLVSGVVTESNTAIGDLIREGEVIYKLDSTSAELAVQKAENEVQKAKATQSETEVSLSGLKIYANASGIIENISIQKGSTINGGEIATIRRDDEREISVLAGIKGTVQSVSVREGQAVRNGQLVATLTDPALEASEKGQSIDIKTAELALESAKKELERYTIKSPVTGTVTAKAITVGDNVSVGDREHPMMIIANTEEMKFVVPIDEFNVWNMELGQKAKVTADALPNEKFTGEVTNVASEGKAKDNGITTYDVEVTLPEPGDLKAGMNINAKIILKSVTNVLTVPEKALIGTTGTNAFVLTKNAALDVPTTKEENENPEETNNYSWIKVPEGCSVTPVRIGISDGTNVQITSGLSEGDIVVYSETEPMAIGTPPSPSASPGASGKPNEDNKTNNAPNPSGNPTNSSAPGATVNPYQTTPNTSSRPNSSANPNPSSKPTQKPNLPLNISKAD